MRIHEKRKTKDASWHPESFRNSEVEPSRRSDTLEPTAPAAGVRAGIPLGKPGDRFEREAESVAEHIAEMPTDDRAIAHTRRPLAIQRIQQRPQSPPRGEADTSASGLANEHVGGETAPDAVHDVLESGGEPLSSDTRQYMEPRFGHDFSQVRVHTDDRAAASAKSVNARAFTVGRNVVFGSGQYSPETAAGERLIAHELTHVVQQQSIGSARLQRDDDGTATVEAPRQSSSAAAVYARFLVSVPASMAESLIGGITNLLFLNQLRNELILLEVETPESAARIRGLIGIVEARSLTAGQERNADARTTGANGVGTTFDPNSQTSDVDTGTPGSGGEDIAGLQGTKVEQYGIAYKQEGVNLRDHPSSHPDSRVLKRLEFNTRMYVDSEVDEHYFVGTDGGQFGYVATTHVKTNLPEPNAKIYHIEPGDTALEISRKHYGGEAKWGSDHRFYVNGLVHVNRGEGQRGIFKSDPDADWDTTEVRAGYMIWVPSLEFMRSLRGVVGSGSITYEAWQTVKGAVVAAAEFLLGAGAFTVGLLHGALESIWDIFVGLKDLAVMAVDLVKWLIGLVTGDSESLFDSLSGIEWGRLVQGWIDNFEAKWNDESILKRWHFRGWVIGYAIAEAVMLIFSGGVIQGIKWVGKSAKVAKVLASMPRIAKLGEAAKSSKTGQRLARALKGGSMSARAANKFVLELLQKPASIWGKGPDEIADAFRSVGYTVNVQQSSRGSKLSKQIRLSNPPDGAPQITRIQVHPGGGRHGGSYYKISSSESSFGTKWVADRATFKVQAGMDQSKIVWIESGLQGWMLRAATANSAAQRGARDE